MKLCTQRLLVAIAKSEVLWLRALIRWIPQYNTNQGVSESHRVKAEVLVWWGFMPRLYFALFSTLWSIALNCNGNNELWPSVSTQCGMAHVKLRDVEETAHTWSHLWAEALVWGQSRKLCWPFSISGYITKALGKIYGKQMLWRCCTWILTFSFASEYVSFHVFHKWLKEPLCCGDGHTFPQDRTEYIQTWLCFPFLPLSHLDLITPYEKDIKSYVVLTLRFYWFCFEILTIT